MNKEYYDAIYSRRFENKFDELKWLYIELYQNESMLYELCSNIKNYYDNRNKELINLDIKREINPDWFLNKENIGIIFDSTEYEELEELNEYILNLNINMIITKIDMKYFYKDRNKIHSYQPLKNNRLENLLSEYQKKGISILTEYEIKYDDSNSESAYRARQGDNEYRNMYYFYDEDKIIDNNISISKIHKTYLKLDENNYVRTAPDKNMWELNYNNPRVFNRIISDILNIVNFGIDGIILKNPEEIEINKTNSDYHRILRMIKIILEIAAPSVILLVKNKSDYCNYDKQTKECDIQLNNNFTQVIWNAVATRNIKLLRNEIERKKEISAFNYILDNNPVIWKLNYSFLKKYGINEELHKIYLKRYFEGKTGYSNSRARSIELNDGNFGTISTTSSMCGLEKAINEMNECEIEKSVDFITMLYAFLFILKGVPCIKSGDEIGKINNYNGEISKENDRFFAVDENTIEGKLMRNFAKLINIRGNNKEFDYIADFKTIDTCDNSIIGIERKYNEKTIIGLFNFSEHDKKVMLLKNKSEYEDLMTGNKIDINKTVVPGRGFYYLKEI